VHAGRHPRGHGYPEPAELAGFVRVVAEQGDPELPRRLQHLRGDDALDGFAQLRPAVAPLTAEHIPGEAHAMRPDQRHRAALNGWDSRGPITQPEGEVLLASTSPLKLNTRAAVAYPSANRRGSDTWARIVAVGSGMDRLGQSVWNRGESA
jgi:hypothetical protein